MRPASHGTAHKTAPSSGEQSTLHQLNVAIVSDAAPGRNGVGTFYIDLQRHLAQCVNRVELFSPTVIGEKWQAGLVFPLPGDKTQKLCMPNPFALRRQLNDLAPHIVIIATPGVYGLFGAFFAGRMGVPSVAGFHTSFEQITKLYWKNNSAAARIVRGYFKVSNDYLFKKCPLVLANSEAMMEQAKRLGAQKTQLIATTVSPVFTDHLIQPYRGSLKRILFAGRLAPEKNIEALIQASKAMPELEFTIAGDGPERPQLEALAATQDNIHCLGWLQRDALRDEIDKHDMLVLPSHFESFGTIALEAMARQRLVIVSSSCGIAEWQAFNSGLYIMGSRSFTETLQAVAKITNEERIQKARHALELTQTLNQHGLQQWFDLFLAEARI